MRFKKHDAGRAMSQRPKQSRDCTVRALATVASFNYDLSYMILHEAGRECSKGFDIETWAGKTTLVDGAGDKIYWRLQKMPYTKPHDGPGKRYRISEFMKDRPKGRFIVASAKHVFAVVDGVMHDDAPWHFVEDRPVYAWMEAIVVRLPLWQCSAVRRPIRKGRPMMKRRIALVEGVSYKLAMLAASKMYEWALKTNEDLTVEALP